MTDEVRLPEEGETITSTRPSEVAFYEAAFPTGLRFSLHPTIRLILQFYNICPAQLVPNAWRSIVCSMAMWRVCKYTLSLSEFRNLFSLNSNPKSDQGWLYFKARNKKALLEGSPLKGASRVPRAWGVPDKHYNNPPRLYGDEPKVFEEIFKSVEKTGRFSVSVLLDLKSFRHVFVSPGSMASGTAGENHPNGEALSSSGDVAMSKRISFKKLGEKLEKSRNGSSLGIFAPAKEVVIGEKRAGENLASSASKRGKADDGSKGKGVDRKPEGKKKATSPTNAPTTPATASSRPEEGTSATLGAALGPTASILALVLGSSLVIRSREAGEQASLQEGRAASMEIEANDELAKTKSDRNSLTNKVERPGVLVVELREALSKAKESAVEEFKSSSEFMVAIEDSASKYFGEGFDFCKVQLRRHHPDLAIDLEGTMVDQDLLAEQDEATRRKKRRRSARTRG
ncbi:hypothetical protein Acr_03g0013660 [Actinidia rufa]|uniref:Uncharacterized protein n=1 Tax=Actinidia rufa TaxID=165716 RepID=A0A7J0EE33_9ERIC|nr:hypothetical protein Acr_03g0013660 [Actinidia rufa]